MLETNRDSHDWPETEGSSQVAELVRRVYYVCRPGEPPLARRGIVGIADRPFANELALFEELVADIREMDPDLLVGCVSSVGCEL